VEPSENAPFLVWIGENVGFEKGAENSIIYRLLHQRFRTGENFLDTISKSKTHDCKRNLSAIILKGNEVAYS